MPLRRLSGALGRLLASLGRFLGASWAIVGRSWPLLGWLGPLLGCIFTPRDSPSLDFGGFGGWPGLVLEGFGNIFWHAFCCASHFETKCVYSCRDHVFSFTSALHSFPSGAAVCAQHIRRLPKGCRACQTLIISSSLCLPLRLAFRIRLQIPTSKAFPHPFVPSPGPAHTAALRPQFALEASKCDF